MIGLAIVSERLLRRRTVTCAARLSKPLQLATTSNILAVRVRVRHRVIFGNTMPKLNAATGRNPWTSGTRAAAEWKSRV